MNYLLNSIIDKIVSSEGRKFFRFNNKSRNKPLSFAFNNRDIKSLYIHIPFCKSLCPFCSFNRYVYSEELVKRYFSALTDEARMYFNLGYNFSNVYFGGGTPTVNIDLLSEFIINLKKLFDIKTISIETTPRELDPVTINKLEELKVDRLSIGVQSFDDILLNQIGRVNQFSKDVIQSIMLAKNHFKTINVDLIFNFPSQSIDSFKNDIKTFNDLDIEQVTFYPLMPTPYKHDLLTRKFRKIDKKREIEFYNIIQEEMLERYQTSTVWCFSKGDNIIDEYIVDDFNYIGLGAGSVSFIDSELHVNTFSPENYNEKISNKQFPIIISRKSSLRQRARYYLLTKCFGMKVSKKDMIEKFGKTLFFEIFLIKLIGVIKEKEDTLYVTKSGMYCINIMMKNFFTSLNILREYCMKNKL